MAARPQNASLSAPTHPTEEKRNAHRSGAAGDAAKGGFGEEEEKRPRIWIYICLTFGRERRKETVCNPSTLFSLSLAFLLSILSRASGELTEEKERMYDGI